jgi:hypothetical protein
MGNSNLRESRKAKNDEFYTQLSTIENEVMHYREHFKDKTVYLNCDDPRESNFFHYFSYNFEKLGLKKLIASCYKSQDFNLFSMDKKVDKAVWLEYTGETDGGRIPTAEAIGVHNFNGDGDFRSEESIELLKQADIVVTNPPFSLFREFISLMMEHNKKFLLIGNSNAITYKEIFPLIKDNKLWMGINDGPFDFIIPKNSPNKKFFEKDGKRLVKFGNITWWTNLEHNKRHKDIILYKKYKGNEKDYPKYDNYNAINVDKTQDIPLDYDGVMGVPISIIDKWNPEQFEIIGQGRNGLAPSPIKMSKEFVEDYYKDGGTGSYAENAPLLALYNKEGKAIIPYMRILIRNKKIKGECVND